MPSHDQHAAQAAHNGELLVFMEQQGKHGLFSDWYVTVAFYTALHHFEAALFAVKPPIYGPTMPVVEHSSNHCARNEMIKVWFKQIQHPTYSALYKISKAARYNCHTPGAYNWAQAKMLLDLVKKECDRLVPAARRHS